MNTYKLSEINGLVNNHKELVEQLRLCDSQNSTIALIDYRVGDNNPVPNVIWDTGDLRSLMRKYLLERMLGVETELKNEYNFDLGTLHNSLASMEQPF